MDLERRSLLASAAATAAYPGLSRAAGDDIVVGQIGPFTGMPAHDAPELNQGIRAAFAQINAAGGVNGRQLSLFELDDGYVPPGLVQKLAGEGACGVALAQVFPNPNGNTSALQHTFHGAMKRMGTAGPFTAFQLEGYVTARVLAEALRRAREASPAALARALRTMGDVNLGGFRIDFSKGNVGSAFVDIAVMNRDGRLTY
jgi:ABC-type branched-subunit amino acid transport system substrate-binding protein